jgi:hypothetical protein
MFAMRVGRGRVSVVGDAGRIWKWVGALKIGSSLRFAGKWEDRRDERDLLTR